MSEPINLPGLPDISLSKLEYDEAEGTLDVEILPSDVLNEHVGREKKLNRAATHEESTIFIAEIIGKALSKTDGFSIEEVEE